MVFTQRAPQLPFIPSPFHDEILGSWLSRIRIENESGAWRVLLEHVGFRRRLANPLFDIADHNEKLSAMLALLGTSYERALLELTTLPYWLTFTASDSSTRLPGTATIPMLQKIGSEAVVTSIRQLGSERTRRKSFEPRYCAKCISQDYEEVGQAYWHRAHQLPNVFFCHKHHSELQVKCAACGAKPSGQNSKVLPLPTLKCQCGFRLDKAIQSRIPSTQELALIRVSVRALGQGVPNWHRGGVFNFLEAKLAQGQSLSLGQYQSVLEEAFPGTLVKPTDRASVDESNAQLRFRRFLKSGSAPECCALMIALDITYENALAGFMANSVAEVSRESRESRLYPKNAAMTVEGARAAICRAQQLNSNGSISSNRRVYWFLQIYDPTWLLENFPRKRKPPLPTVTKDRLSLVELLALLVEKPLNEVIIKAKASSPGIRASFRDKKWFDEQTNGLRRHSAAKRSATNGAVLFARATSLQEALTRLLAAEDRPIRIFASTLGAQVGLSDTQAVYSVKSSPQLREAIAAANADKLRRQLLWAARQLSQAGGRFTKQQLGRVAGVPRASISDKILSEIKALHYRI